MMPDYECLFNVRMQVIEIQDKRENTKMTAMLLLDGQVQALRCAYYDGAVLHSPPLDSTTSQRVIQDHWLAWLSSGALAHVLAE